MKCKILVLGLLSMSLLSATAIALEDNGYDVVVVEQASFELNVVKLLPAQSSDIEMVLTTHLDEELNVFNHYAYVTTDYGAELATNSPTSIDLSYFANTAKVQNQNFERQQYTF